MHELWPVGRYWRKLGPNNLAAFPVDRELYLPDIIVGRTAAYRRASSITQEWTRWKEYAVTSTAVVGSITYPTATNAVESIK